MIQTMLAGSYSDAKLYHVRMNFSSDMDDIGRFKVAKVAHLFSLIGRTYAMALTRNIKVLYYPPAGPDLVPVLRDIVFLIAVRWLFRKRIFQFHAAGLSEFYERSPRLLRRMMELAYFNPDIAIRQSRRATDDGRVLRAKTEYVVPYGIADHGGAAESGTDHRESPTILYVGVLREDKGVLVLLEACRLLRQHGRMINLQLVGRLVSAEFEAAFRESVGRAGLEETVSLCGVLTGDAKWRAFREADIFCFPSHFASESFGVCLVEAQSFSLPVVATHWRGIPDVVDDGENGLLVPPRDATALADALEKLIADPVLRQAMGNAGRRKFEREFTLTQYHNRLNTLFGSIGSGERVSDVSAGREDISSL